MSDVGGRGRAGHAPLLRLDLDVLAPLGPRQQLGGMRGSAWAATYAACRVGARWRVASGRGMVWLWAAGATHWARWSAARRARGEGAVRLGGVTWRVYIRRLSSVYRLSLSVVCRRLSSVVCRLSSIGCRVSRRRTRQVARPRAGPAAGTLAASRRLRDEHCGEQAPRVRQPPAGSSQLGRAEHAECRCSAQPSPAQQRRRPRGVVLVRRMPAADRGPWPPGLLR